MTRTVVPPLPSTKVSLSARPSTSLSAKAVKPPKLVRRKTSSVGRPQSATAAVRNKKQGHNIVRSKNGNMDIIVPTAGPARRKDLLHQEENLRSCNRRESMIPQESQSHQDEDEDDRTTMSTMSTDESSSGQCARSTGTSGTASENSGGSGSVDEGCPKEEEVPVFSVDSVCTSPRSDVPLPERQEEAMGREGEEEDEAELVVSMVGEDEGEGENPGGEGTGSSCVGQVNDKDVDGAGHMDDAATAAAPTTTPDTFGTVGGATSTASCTISVSSAFTPDSITVEGGGEGGCGGGYGDVLRVLEKMEMKETVGSDVADALLPKEDGIGAVATVVHNSHGVKKNDGPDKIR